MILNRMTAVNTCISSPCTSIIGFEAEVLVFVNCFPALLLRWQRPGHPDSIASGLLLAEESLCPRSAETSHELRVDGPEHPTSHKTTKNK